MSGDSRFSRSEYLLLALLSFTYFATNADSQVVAPLLPRIREALGATDRQVVWLVALYGAAAAVNSLLIGIAIDRIGGARILPVGYAIFCAGELINSLAPSLGVLIFGRMITGIGSSTLSLGMMIRISEVFGEGRRSKAFGYFVAGGALAAVAGLPIGAWLATKFDYHAPFAAILAITAALGICVVAVSRRDLRAPQVRQANERPGGRFFADLFSRPRLVLVLSLGMLFNIGIYAMLTPLSLWAKAAFDLSTAKIFSYYIVGGIGGLLIAPIAGRMAGRFGVMRLLNASTLGLMLLTPLIPLVPNALWLYAAFFAAAGLDVLRLVPFHVLSLEVADPNYRARFIGLRNTISQSGIFLGAAIGGQIYAGLAAGYFATGIFAAFTCLITFPILFKIGSAREQQAVEAVAEQTNMKAAYGDLSESKRD